MVARNDEDDVIVRRREKKEPPVEDEQVDTELEQDEHGADVDEVTNFLWDLSREVVYLEDFVEGWEEADSDDDRKEIEEELPDQVELVKDRLKKIDDFKVKFGKDAPTADEYETELRDRAERLIKKARTIMNR